MIKNIYSKNGQKSLRIELSFYQWFWKGFRQVVFKGGATGWRIDLGFFHLFYMDLTNDIF